MKTHLSLLCTLLFLLGLLSVLQAQIPETISYQGILSDTSGIPKPDGNYTFTFSLYDTGSGGSPLWNESKSLGVRRGLFFTFLGDQIPFGNAVLFDKTYWLGIKVGNEPELSPRIPLTSVGYSFHALRADTALFSMSAPADTTWIESGSDIYYLRGKVGIGNSSPVYRLDIEGGADPLQITGGGPVFPKFRFNVETGGYSVYRMFDNNTAEDFRLATNGDSWLNGAGNVGIGTVSPARKLDVSGTVKMTGFELSPGAAAGYVLTANATGVGTWQPATGGGAKTLDEAYDGAGSGAGRIITADAGAVDIDGPDGLRIEGNTSVGDEPNPAGDILLQAKRQLNIATPQWGVFSELKNTSTGQMIGVLGGAHATTQGSGGNATGVYGVASNDNSLRIGVSGVAQRTSAGDVNGGSVGVEGRAFNGVTAYGVSGVASDAATGYGVYGNAFNNTTSYAGYFAGNVEVTGTLTKGAGSFKIDHPLSPENKYLYHSFVESPDMKNIYDGVVELNGDGEAEVRLPEWFEALNRDFRYQLTCIGGFAPVYIAEEINENRFKIAGGRAGLKVSWQVTGIRHDRFAESNRIPLEVDKPNNQIGKYLHPEVYGLSAEYGIDYENHKFLVQKREGADQ